MALYLYQFSQHVSTLNTKDQRKRAPKCSLVHSSTTLLPRENMPTGIAPKMCCFLPPLPSEKSKNRLRKNSNSLQCFITQKPNKHTPLPCFPCVLSMFPLPRHSNIFKIPLQRSCVRWDWAWNVSLHNKTQCACKFHFYPVKDNRNAQDSYSPSALCWKEWRTKPFRSWKGQ